MSKLRREEVLLEMIRTGEPMTWHQRLDLIVRLSIPSILAQLSVSIMLYIDAAMVGSLGANASASIGLMSTSMWLCNGIMNALALGFAVQVAHRLGASDFAGARSIVRQGLVSALLFGVAFSLFVFSISRSLPVWLGGNADIVGNSGRYFGIYALSLPFVQMQFLCNAMLRSSGNMRIPSLLSVMMCLMDVGFNSILIFPTREVAWGSLRWTMPGADMGVAGAALGTALSVVVVVTVLLYYLCRQSRELAINQEQGRFRPTRGTIREALRIALPIGMEQSIMCGAQIASTTIVAPLGSVAIAANALSITSESLCYMPGFGIGDAATALVGQSKGAGRVRTTVRFARMTVWVGITVMAVIGCFIYFAAPFMLSILTPDEAVRALGVRVLRIEAFAEPMFAAAIVSYRAMIGAGDTMVPSCMNFGSIWLVRLTLAALLAPTMGLRGVWIAMCVELCFRGLIFLIRLYSGHWLRKPVAR